MECREVLENVVARLAGEEIGDRARAVDEHLDGCAACRGERELLEASWERLGDAAGDPEATSRYRERTLGRMDEALRRSTASNVVSLRPRSLWRPLLQVAALLVTGVLGWTLARVAAVPRAATPVLPASTTVALLPERHVDVSRASLDLSGSPRLANVAFTPAEAGGRLAVSFDVTTRYTVVGRPDDAGVASLLAYVVSEGSATEGVRGKALDVVARELKGPAAASPEIVSVLAETLTRDRNPGVRKKAAEALVQLPPSATARDAFARALKSDTNPAIRMLAVEGLARAATELRDPVSIETLREKAVDTGEAGAVRVRAASALRGIKL